MLFRFYHRAVTALRLPLWLLYGVCGVFGILFIVPLLWPLLASINPEATLAITVPEHPGLGNFLSLLTDIQVISAFRTSFLLSGATTFLVVLCSLCVAYPLSHYRVGWKNKFLFSLLICGFFSFFSLVLPLYALYSLLDVLNTLSGVVFFLVASALPLGIWLITHSFALIPRELEEAATLDGSSSLSTFVRIVLPLCFSDISLVALWSFLEAWTNFQVPFVLLQNPHFFPVPVQLYTWFGASIPVHYGPLAAYLVMYSIPAVFIYLPLSQRFVSSISSGFLDGTG